MQIDCLIEQAPINEWNELPPGDRLWAFGYFPNIEWENWLEEYATPPLQQLKLIYCWKDGTGAFPKQRMCMNNRNLYPNSSLVWTMVRARRKQNAACVQ